jgi:hypothetical protein
MAATKLYSPQIEVTKERQRALPIIIFAEQVTTVAEAAALPSDFPRGRTLEAGRCKRK